MIVFAHTKFGLVRIQESRVKRGAESAPPPSLSEFFKSGPDRVKPNVLYCIVLEPRVLIIYPVLELPLLP